jgi:hypothetical protein
VLKISRAALVSRKTLDYLVGVALALDVRDCQYFDF